MKSPATFRSKLSLGNINYVIEVTALNPHVAQAQFLILEKYIRNGIQKDIVMGIPEYVKK